MKPIWIELVDDGVANRFNFEDHELIEINWRLTEHPSMYKAILEHELEHSDGDYDTKDLTHDLKAKVPGLFKFMWKNPSTWIQLLPIYYSRRRKTFVYDWSAIVNYLIAGSVAWAVYYFLGGVF